MQRDATLDRKQLENLDTINRSGEHLLALINEVLEISKIETGKIALKITPFDLHELLREVMNMFEDSAERKGLLFESVGLDEIPRCVLGDESKLRRILINLLGNAVKFTEEGRITVWTGIECQNTKSARLWVEIIDTGPGIAEDEIDNVFRYFEQTDSGRKNKSGTGLGLAISRDFARKMGGDITFTSEVGKGSTFRLEIDIEEGSESGIMDKTKPACVVGLEAGQRVPRILVAEDNDESRELLVRLLQTTGFEVREAEDGKRAIEVFEAWKPDFIWMDVRMPIMDGTEATRYIKESKAGESTRIVALTAHALEEEREQILATGYDDFVRKPFREKRDLRCHKETP